jgi:hypothetical protein
MADRPLDARPLDADVAPGVEIAEKGPDFERRVGEPAGVRNRPDPAAADLAGEDLVLGELDKDGHGSGTFIAKGDPIPPALRALPRRAAREAPRKK